MSNLLLEGTNATDQASTSKGSVPPPGPLGQRSTSVAFLVEGYPLQLVVSIPLLCAENIESNPGPNYYKCDNLSRKQFACSGLHHSNLSNRRQIPCQMILRIRCA